MMMACSSFKSILMLFNKGKPNANVFPLPVCASARTSWPATILGTVACCISVGVLNREGMAATVFALRVSLSNDINEPSIKVDVESNRAVKVRE